MCHGVLLHLMFLCMDVDLHTPLCVLFVYNVYLCHPPCMCVCTICVCLYVYLHHSVCECEKELFVPPVCMNVHVHLLLCVCKKKNGFPLPVCIHLYMSECILSYLYLHVCACKCGCATRYLCMKMYGVLPLLYVLYMRVFFISGTAHLSVGFIYTFFYAYI